MEVEQWGLLPPVEPEHFFFLMPGKELQNKDQSIMTAWFHLINACTSLCFKYIDLFMNSETRVRIRLIAKK